MTSSSSSGTPGGGAAASETTLWAVPLALSGFNVVLAVLGGFAALFGLVSHLVKDDWYLSEALISLLAGVVLGPHAANWIRPEAYASPSPPSSGSLSDLDALTLAFSRLVLGVQLVIAGVQLPGKYVSRQWKPLALLLGPGMACMWLSTSLLVWGLARPPSVLHALAVGACVTPTDPVLSAVVVRGGFADRYVPRDLQDLIVAESGANDGLGYPFLFLALYLIKLVGGPGGGGGGGHAPSDAGTAVGLWFAMSLGYTVLLSVAYGGLVGYLAGRGSRWARGRGLVHRDNGPLVYPGVGLFVVGTCGLIGTDDVLASFVAGSALASEGRTRKRDDVTTEGGDRGVREDHDHRHDHEYDHRHDRDRDHDDRDDDDDDDYDALLPALDSLLNVTVFAWYGAVIPWPSFARNAVIPTGRLVALGILVMLLRRLPWILAMHKLIPQTRGWRDAAFTGFFGPVGVSAVFYLFVTLQFIGEHLGDGEGGARGDVRGLGEMVRVVVWFITVCSITVHGLSIPVGRLVLLTARALCRAGGGSRIGRGTGKDGGGASGMTSGGPIVSRAPTTDSRPCGTPSKGLADVEAARPCGTPSKGLADIEAARPGGVLAGVRVARAVDAD